MALNFLDPYFYVRIGNRRGIRVFAVSGGSQDEEANIGRYLTQLSVTEKSGGFGSIQITLEPPRDLALGLLNSSVLEMGGMIEIHWGYPSYGDLRTAYGILTIPDVQIGTQISITINAEGGPFSAMRTSRNHVWREDPSDETSPPMSIAQIVHDFAIDNGFPISSIVFEVSNDRMERTPETPYHQKGTSDWIFLKEILARKSASISVRGGSILRIVGYEYPQNRAVATFRMFGQLNLANNIYPMLGFSTSQAGVVVGLLGRGVTAKAINPVTGPEGTIGDGTEPRVLRKDNTTSTIPMSTDLPLGGRPEEDVPSPFDTVITVVDKQRDETKGQEGKNVTVSGRDERAAESMQAMFDQARRGMLEAQVEVIGVPGVEPDTYVNLEGIGRALFDGSYLVHEVTHNLGDGYTMSLRTTRDSYGQQPAAATPAIQATFALDPDDLSRMLTGAE